MHANRTVDEKKKKQGNQDKLTQIILDYSYNILGSGLPQVKVNGRGEKKKVMLMLLYHIEI